MTKRMLIDATHPEETRVAIVNGNKLEEYDYENIIRKQIKSNIYLVKVTRVEPSLQAAFVDFGGNRHGFLPFPEIHPDYYRIPIADREALLAEERALAEAQSAKEDAEDEEAFAAAGLSKGKQEAKETAEDDIDTEGDTEETDTSETEDGEQPETEDSESTAPIAAKAPQSIIIAESDDEETVEDDEETVEDDEETIETEDSAQNAEDETEGDGTEEEATTPEIESEDVETVGGDTTETPVFRSSIKRRYKIQEVIKRNQIMLIQINREERGNKGAAVTSYISLPGRYCVLMPNSPRGGGVSRKVSNVKDRQRLKQILKELGVPEGMSVILRTAGVTRSKAEIKRDLDYLLRLWDQIRELTLQSTAPAVVYEEGDLVKRSIRDLYKRDITQVLVAGETGYKNARAFMKTLMPSHVRKVVQYKEENMPLFLRYQVDSQIDAIHSPTVHLKSGGYIVINPTEALISIDVNSGKATKGRHIEETALKTNLEASDEIARQLRLRDMGGLVVIDFIDMEDRRSNRTVERRVQDAMANDRARIQIGRISAFGLMEMSRQRLNPSLVETNFEVCTTCVGTGLIRTVETTAVIVLRGIEEEALRGKAADIKVSVPTEVALYIFNNKRLMLAGIEERYNITISLHADDTLIKPDFKLDITRSATKQKEARRNKKPAPIQDIHISDLPPVDEEEDEVMDQDSNIEVLDDDKSSSPRKEARRRGRRGGRRRGGRDRTSKPRDEQNESSTNADNSQAAASNGNDQEPAHDNASQAPAVAVNASTNNEKTTTPAKEPRKGWWKRITE